MYDVERLLSQIPSLRHLTVVTRSFDAMDGSRWEVLIKTKLLSLNKFEFYMSSRCCLSAMENVEPMFNEVTARFRTPFWTEEKRWLVVCHLFRTPREAEMCTSPICTSWYSQVFDPNMKTVCNFERENQHSTLSND
jgi:hypothetical protein